MYCWGIDHVIGWDCPERSSSVKGIRIMDGFLSGPALSSLTSSCKALEMFDYESKDSTYDHYHFTSLEAAKAFETQKHSLRVLMLKYAEVLNSRNIWDLLSYDEIGPLNLRNLEKLTVLKVEYDELFDEVTAFEDLLPSSLEKLTLRSCRGGFMENIVTDLFDLTDVRGDRFPRLTSIGVEIENLERWSCTPLLDLDGHLSHSGIDFYWWSDEADCGMKELLDILVRSQALNHSHG